MVDDSSVALCFGITERGCESKRGTNQGVVISRGFIAEGLVALKELVHADSSFFPTSPAKFRKSWQKQWDRERSKKKKVPKMRAIHDLRHAAAAEDISRGRRDLAGVQRQLAILDEFED